MKLISLKGFSTLIYFNASTLQYSIEFSTLIYINTLQISNGIFNINLFQREYFAIFNTLKKKNNTTHVTIEQRVNVKIPNKPIEFLLRDRLTQTSFKDFSVWYTWVQRPILERTSRDAFDTQAWHTCII